MRAFNSMEKHQSFKVRSGGKQGCVLATQSLCLQHAFDGNKDGIYLRTRFNGSHFNLKRLKSK